eukprot:5378709-Pleurochrysis_carterae.AAC.3
MCIRDSPNGNAQRQRPKGCQGKVVERRRRTPSPRREGTKALALGFSAQGQAQSAIWKRGAQ